MIPCIIAHAEIPHDDWAATPYNSFMNPTLSVHNLSKSFRLRKPTEGLGEAWRGLWKPEYRQVDAVKQINFALHAGERVAFIGPNGAGKSTTIKMAAGILYPSDGHVSVLGLDPQKQRKLVTQKIGAVFGQRSQLWYHLPARDSFDLLAKIYAIEESEYRVRLKRLVDAFDLGDILSRPVRQLSLGQRMRCEIVASLLHKPQVLFLDEPTIGLDVDAKASIRDLIRRTAAEDGTTVLLTSHDTGDIEQVCDRVIVIDHGQIILDESIGGLRQRYIRTKRVTVHTTDACPALDLPGLTWVEKSPHRLVMEVDTALTPAGAAVGALLQKVTATDISVEDPPMDDIVRQIYAERRDAL